MTTATTATRYHDISCWHRVVGQGGKCEHLHGHNYRVHFTVEGPAHVTQRDMVTDFGVINSRLCQWLEEHWDHKLLLWCVDEWATDIASLDPRVALVPFNPTAENMARYLLMEIGPMRLADLDVWLTKVTVEETSKCSATCELSKR